MPWLFNMMRSRNSFVLSLLLMLPLVASCSPTALTGDNQRSRYPGNAGLPFTETSNSDILTFRDGFIRSHTIYSTCDGLPYLASSLEGDYFFSKTGGLGNTAADWPPLTNGEIVEHGGLFLKLSVRNGVPLIASSGSISSLEGVRDSKPVHLCAVISDQSSSENLADIWPYDPSSIEAINARTLIRAQASINQPVLLSWTADVESESNDSDKTDYDINVKRGYRAEGGEYYSEKGLHKIWTACSDIFNISPETSCSSPLIIEIGSS